MKAHQTMGAGALLCAAAMLAPAPAPAEERVFTYVDEPLFAMPRARSAKARRRNAEELAAMPATLTDPLDCEALNEAHPQGLTTLAWMNTLAGLVPARVQFTQMADRLISPQYADQEEWPMACPQDGASAALLINQVLVARSGMSGWGWSDGRIKVWSEDGPAAPVWYWVVIREGALRESLDWILRDFDHTLGEWRFGDAGTPLDFDIAKTYRYGLDRDFESVLDSLCETYNMRAVVNGLDQTVDFEPALPQG